MIVFTHFIAWVHGYEKSKRFWLGLLNESRERNKEYRKLTEMRVAELADKVGGKCPTCKGWGVVGEDGSSDCLTCCGTGVRDLSHLKDQNEIILKLAINQCDTTRLKLQEMLQTITN